MAQLAVAAAGAAATSAIGLGPSAGWLAGSIVGGLLFPSAGQDVVQEGPRLGDLSITASSYGIAIPIVYGTVRQAGNMIWTTGIEEVKNVQKQEVGGKGGGGGSTSTTITYEYFSSFAIGFCEGVVDDVTRIWADGKLIYDTTGSGDDITKVNLSFRFYTGSETQNPDGLIEADKGVNSTPAFRGLCYVVFERLPLKDFGNRVPNITAELTTKPSNTKTTQDVDLITVAEGGISDFFSTGDILPTYDRGSFYTVTQSSTAGNNALRRINTRTMAEDRQTTYTNDANSQPITLLNLTTTLPNGTIIVHHFNGSGQVSVSSIDPDTQSIIGSVGPAVVAAPRNGLSSWIQVLGGTGNEYYILGAGDANKVFILRSTNTALSFVWDSAAPGTPSDFTESQALIYGTCAGAIGTNFGEGYVFAGPDDLSTIKFYRVVVNGGANFDATSGTYTGVTVSTIATISASTLVPGETTLANLRGPIYDVTDDSVMIQVNAPNAQVPYMIKLDTDNGNVIWRTAIPGLKVNQQGTNHTRIDVGNYGQVDNNNTWALRTSTGEQYYNVTAWPRYHIPGSGFWDGKNGTFIGASADNITLQNIGNQTFPATTPNISDIYFKPDGTIIYLCQFLDSFIRGYTLATPWDITSAISLQSSLSVTAVEGAFIRQSDGGKLFYVAGATVSDRNLTTPWGVGSATGGNNFNPAIGPLRQVWVDPTGTKLFLLTENNNGRVYRYTMSTPWSVSGPPTLDNFLQVGSAVVLNMQGMCFNEGGTELYICEGLQANATFLIYDLSTPWDLTTASFRSETDVSAQINNGLGIYKQFNGPYLYIPDQMSGRVEQYTFGTPKISKWLFFRGAGGDAGLNEIIQDLNQRGGLSASEIDVNALTSDLVPGYTIGRSSTIRSIIDPLTQIYFFDGVESDFKLKYIKRDGKAVSADITQPELVRIQEGFLREDRTQEVELPVRFTLTYLDRDRDFLQASHNAKRVLNPVSAMSSRNEIGLSAPIALRSDLAKQSAEKALYSSWIERSSYSFQLSWRYLALDPSDIVTITLDDGTIFRNRLVQADTGADLSLAMTALSEDAAQYTSTVTSDGGDLIPQEFLSVSNTKLIVLCSPLLLDRDDIGRVGSVLYYLMGGFGQPGWTAGSLLKSNEGATFASVGGSVSEMAWGTASNALGDTDLPFQTDEVNSVTVYMNTGADELVSVTQLEMLNGANAAALIPSDPGKPEIFQFRDVVVNADGSRTLSGLLRGRRGSETFTGLHAAGDTFVLLTTADVQQINLSLGEKDQTRFYKAVTSGQLFEDAVTTTKASPLNDLKPYAPVNQKATIGGGNDITLTWVRRTRVGGQLQDGTGTVPLSEDSEEYELEIFDGPGGSIVRTVTGLTSSTYLYTSANQVTDGFTPPLTQITIKVYQISAQVGRGFTAEVTLDVQ